MRSRRRPRIAPRTAMRFRARPPSTTRDCRRRTEGDARDRTGASTRTGSSVGFLIVDGVYNTELTAPFDMFHHSAFHADPGMHVFSVAPTLEPVTTFEGIRVLRITPSRPRPRSTSSSSRARSTAWTPTSRTPRLIEWVRKRWERRCRVRHVALRWGLRPGAGGSTRRTRRATTFPTDIERHAPRCFRAPRRASTS